MRTDARNLAGVAAGLTLAAALLLPAALAGCGGDAGGPEADPRGSAEAIGPHGGPALPMGESGYAEVNLEPDRGKAILAVYFYGPDLASAMADEPIGVVAEVLTPGRSEPLALTLSPKPDTGARRPGALKVPSGLRFASPPGRLEFEEMTGTLSATVGSQAHSVRFTIR